MSVEYVRNYFSPGNKLQFQIKALYHKDNVTISFDQKAHLLMYRFELLDLNVESIFIINCSRFLCVSFHY